jgi:hypothetical protein
MAKTVSQIRRNPETDRLEFNGEDLHCGMPLEVLIVDRFDGKIKWVQTRLEYRTDWYLVGQASYQPDGLFAKIN